MRAPGMTWCRLPLFIWAQLCNQHHHDSGTPVLAITIILVAAERFCHLGIFDPKLGGDPLLFQHLFWFYSHPAVYIMILPAMGVISESSRASRASAYSDTNSWPVVSIGDRHPRIPGVGASHVCCRPVALCRHDFLASQLPGGHSFRHQGVQLDRTLYKGSISYTTPMLYALGFIGCSRSAA